MEHRFASLNRTCLRLTPLLLTLLLAASCSRGLPKEFPAPAFALKDVFSGKDITLSSLKGRPVLLYFFASW